MWAAPMVSVSSCVIPVVPAWPKKSARTDQPKAARVPSDTRVSMVAAPCLRLAQAARWKGSPAYATTGQVSAKASHCQPLNWSAGTIESSTTGTVSTMLVSSRARSGSGSGSGSGAGGGGSSAV